MRKPAVKPDLGANKHVYFRNGLKLAHDLGVPLTTERLRALEQLVADKAAATREKITLADKQRAESSNFDKESRTSKRSRTLLAARLSEPMKTIDGYSSGDESDERRSAPTSDDSDSDRETAASLGEDWEEFDREMAMIAGIVDWQACSNSSASDADVYSLSTEGTARRRSRTNNEPMSCMYAQNKMSREKQTLWLLDSGASLHFTHDINDFIEYGPLREEMTVVTANGRTHATGAGTVLLNCGTERVCISPVYYIPELTSRLLSMGEFLREGLIVKGSATHVTLIKPDGHSFLTFYPRGKDDTIFCVKSDDYAQALLGNALIFSVDYETMHKRFAHPSRDVLAHARDHTVDFPDMEIPAHTPICRGCAEGKMPLRPFRPNAKRATRPGQTIHSDMKSFPVPSYRKNKYFTGYLDDFSSHAWVDFLKKKSATYHSTRQFLEYLDVQYEIKVREWMSDGGGEYKSEFFDNMLKDRGIKILQSAPHTPQQNGRAERMMRTLMNKAEAMRLDAGLPDSWWEFAVQHAVHVYNRTPIRRLGWKTPYEMMNGEAPSISHLRVFGCGAYVHIPAETRANKLAPKSELMIYLGAAPGGHGNIFMRMPNNVVYTSAHAIFDETLFPRRSKMTKRSLNRLPNELADIPAGLDDDEEPRQPSTLR